MKLLKRTAAALLIFGVGLQPAAAAQAAPASQSRGSGLELAVTGQSVAATTAGRSIPFRATRSSPEEDRAVALADGTRYELVVSKRPVSSPGGFDASRYEHTTSQGLVRANVPAGIAGEGIGPTVVAVATFAGPDSLGAAWPHEPTVLEYAVLREGVVVQRTARPGFTDVGLERGRTYTYEVVPIRTTGSSAADEVSSRSLSLRTLNQTQEGASVAQDYQPYSTAVQYETFIEPSRVRVDLVTAMGCALGGARPGDDFGGDARSFRTPAFASPEFDSNPDYRTMMFAVVNWDNPAPYHVLTLKAVRPTRLYRGGTVVATRTASIDGMRFEGIYRSGAYAEVRFNHAAGNPFCSAGTIRYNVVHRFYRSGVVETVGWRQQAPHHEVYSRFNNSGEEFWLRQFHGTNAGFKCLVRELCSLQTINARSAS